MRADFLFAVADLFEWLPSGPSVDLVVDWMCFHEMAPMSRKTYASLVAKKCRRYLAIKIFSTEGASGLRLPDALPGVRKYQFSRNDIEMVFGEYFEIEYVQSYPEDANPDVPHSDGIVAAKMAYLLKRREDQASEVRSGG